MKKAYEKPTAILMELRPEEKMAVCEWPIGFITAGGTGCVQTFADIPQYHDLCLGMYNNAQTSSS